MSTDHEPFEEDPFDGAVDLTKRAADVLIKCPRCASKVRPARMRGHQKSNTCIAQTRTREMLKKGFITSTDSFIIEVCTGAGAPVERVETQYQRPAWGNGQGFSHETWVPGWIASLLYRPWELFDKFDRSEALPYFIEAMRQAVAEPEVRHALEALPRVTDDDRKAFHALIFNHRVRAEKFRDEAAERRRKALILIEEAQDFERRAEELDPPPEGVARGL